MLITDERTDAHPHARTGVTLNAPPPFFEGRGHNYYVATCLTYCGCYNESAVIAKHFEVLAKGSSEVLF